MLNKEEIQRNYKAINTKIHTKLEHEKENRHILFTFNFNHIRIKSPDPKRVQRLFE